MKDEATYESHESYGLLQISRVSGGAGNVFGSSVKHFNRVRLRICTAQVKRDLSNDWYHDEHEIIEVEMSPVQWAEAITNMNCGVGSPCTILCVQGKQMKDCPERNERTLIIEEFKDKMRNLVKSFEDSVRTAREALTKKTLLKSDRQDILGALDKLRMELASNVPFVHEQFNEAMEHVVAEAKGEIEAFFTTAVMKAGMQALVSQGPPQIPALEDKTHVAE